MAAGVALLSLFLGVRVPTGSAFVGEVQQDGVIMAEATVELDKDLLKLALVNNLERLYVSAEAAAKLQALLDRRKPTARGAIEVVGAPTMRQVMRRVFNLA